jgi:histidyl-tRNA synthetase
MATGMQATRGTKDIFGPEFDRFEALERLCANTARLWGYAGIRTPVFEDTGLFVRSIGEATDIVEKEMFTVPPREDKGDDKSYTLRPENTAGVVRAYLEHNLHKTQGLAKLFYAGPQFRRERPQAGRLRQFHQFGAEVLGLLREAKGDQPVAPFTAYADVILLAAEVLKRFYGDLVTVGRGGNVTVRTAPVRSNPASRSRSSKRLNTSRAFVTSRNSGCSKSCVAPSRNTCVVEITCAMK